MRVCLVNPPDLNSLDPRLDPPLGLMYISSYLKKHGFEVTLLDLAFHRVEDWEALIKQNTADLYGPTVYSASLNSAIQLAEIIKGTHPGARVVVGGPHPTAIPQCVQDIAEFDFACLGEGEEAMLRLCRTLRQGIKKPSIFWIGQPISNLDVLPFPDRDAVPINGYTRTVEGVRSCALITSRGCLYKCAFCNSPFMWGGVRFHSVAYTLKELAAIRENYGFEAVHFWDDTFTLNHQRLYQILDGIKRLGLIFRCNGDLRRDDEEVHRRLHDAGCREYCVGVESGSKKILKILRKGTRVERNKQVIRSAKKAGLTVKAYIMVGSPGESWETVEETKNFMEEVQPDLWTVFNFIPLPGCDIYHNPEKYGIKMRNADWREYFCIGGRNIGGLTHDTEFMTAEEIAQARQYLIENFPPQRGPLQNYYKKL